LRYGEVQGPINKEPDEKLDGKNSQQSQPQSGIRRLYVTDSNNLLVVVVKQFNIENSHNVCSCLKCSSVSYFCCCFCKLSLTKTNATKTNSSSHSASCECKHEFFISDASSFFEYLSSNAVVMNAAAVDGPQCTKAFEEAIAKAIHQYRVYSNEFRTNEIENTNSDNDNENENENEIETGINRLLSTSSSFSNSISISSSAANSGNSSSLSDDDDEDRNNSYSSNVNINDHRVNIRVEDAPGRSHIDSQLHIAAADNNIQQSVVLIASDENGNINATSQSDLSCSIVNKQEIAFDCNIRKVFAFTKSEKIENEKINKTKSSHYDSRHFNSNLFYILLFIVSIVCFILSLYLNRIVFSLVRALFEISINCLLKRLFLIRILVSTLLIVTANKYLMSNCESKKTTPRNKVKHGANTNSILSCAACSNSQISRPSEIHKVRRFNYNDYKIKLRMCFNLN
jgi:hypothetical protein